MSDQQATVLSKIFSREKPLFYFALWQADDKKALKEYLDYDLKNDLFVIPPPGDSGGIWYSTREFNQVSDLAFEKINSSDEFARMLVEQTERYWALISPYLVDKKRCSSAEEMYTYYQSLVDFWLGMNSVFFLLPDRPGINPIFKEGILRIRNVTQEYTEEMPKVFMDFFTMRFPEYAHLAYYTLPEEAVRLDAALDQSLIAELEERARGGCFMFEGMVYPLSQLDSLLTEHGVELESMDVAGVTEIKGQTASKGTAVGPACLIRTKADAVNMKKGSILITTMTTPELVPIMKIAGAIVTDEGGLTCHAAIVSRELKKPCIIGTKIATQVFKDGDVVEVDAERGIVRKVL